MSNPIEDAVFKLLAERAAESECSEPVDGDQLLHDVSNFFARYLHCSEHQRTVLALWVLHTYSYQAAQVTPYLAIQSAQKQSGKTRCLALLQLLCEQPALVAGLTTSSLFKLLQGPAGTLLLDECQASIGTRGRSKAPVLRAVLAGGALAAADRNPVLRPEPRNKFCPKAFAGKGSLPEDLADLSIPIILEPLTCVAQDRVAQSEIRRGGPPSAVSQGKIERLHLADAAAAVKPLCKHIRIWRNQNLALLEQGPAYEESDFPPNLSPRQQDMIEPLLQIADICGDSWSTRSREALVALFQQQSQFDLLPNLQLLADVRDCFAYHGNPDRLATTDLLDWIYSLPARPWDLDGRFSAHTLARLLVPFGIRPRVLRQGKHTVKEKDTHTHTRTDKSKGKENARFARGYQLQAFQEAWQKHLGVDPINKNRACDGVTLAQPSTGSPVTRDHPITAVPRLHSPVADPLPQGSLTVEDPGLPWANCQLPMAKAHNSKIASKNGARDGVTPAQPSTGSPVTRDHPIAAVPRLHPPVAGPLPPGLPTANCQLPMAKAHNSKIASKNAARDGVTLAQPNPSSPVTRDHPITAVPRLHSPVAGPLPPGLPTANCQLPNAKSQNSKIAGKNRARDGVTLAQPSTGSPITRDHPITAVPRLQPDLPTRLHAMQESLRLQGRYDIPSIIKQFKPEDLKAKLDWAEPNPEWNLKMVNRHCLDFVTALHDINPHPSAKKTERP